MSDNDNNILMAQISAYELRQKNRSDEFISNTSGFDQCCVQGDIVILLKDWANDFLQFCQFNPKPCPLIGMSANAVTIKENEVPVFLACGVTRS